MKLFLQRIFKRSSLRSKTDNTNTIIFPKNSGIKWNIESTFWISTVGFMGRIVLGWFNTTTFHNRDAFLDVVHNRPCDVPLVTVCNHASMFDDPGIIGAMVDLRTLLNQKRMRWSLAAKEICFGNVLSAHVCHHGKVIPIARGSGVYQQGVDYAIKQLNEGGWVHVFPEGKVTLDNVRLKWGVGRMISECLKTPIILPFWHVGMHEFLPCRNYNSVPFFGKVPTPRFGKKITVLFGDPINVCDVISEYRCGQVCERTARQLLTERIQESLRLLRPSAEQLHAQSVA